MVRLRVVAAAVGCWLGTAGPARAQSVRVHGSALAGRAVGGYQEREMSWGGAGIVAGELRVAPAAGVQLQLGSLGLSDGAASGDPSLAPSDGGSGAWGGVGARAYPLVGARGVLSGAWLAASGGATRTGELTRPLVNAQLGVDLAGREGRYGVGPSVAWVHVFQPDDSVRPADANVLLVGVHAVYDPAPVAVDGDRDRDGLRDSVDGCPDEPEDFDRFEDADGCPDTDNDRDGVLDPRDRCPLVAEDQDGFEDEDGCPDADNDRDGLVDAKDRCPNEPEDQDGFEDEDGCPDADNDRDGFVDAKDRCPNEPETKNDYADDDGCPDELQVRVVGDRIVLDDRIHFWVNSAVIRGVSFPLLSRLTKLIADHPEYVHVEVQGHADERGPSDFNLALSEARARSVLEFLVAHGITRERLSSRGFGESAPRAGESTEGAWYENRRVEFQVTRGGNGPAAGDPP